MTGSLKNVKTECGSDFALGLIPRSEANVLSRLSQCRRDERRRRKMPSVQGTDSVCSHEPECLLFDLSLRCRHHGDSTLH